MSRSLHDQTLALAGLCQAVVHQIHETNKPSKQSNS